jgi:hypothetical protein
MRSLQLVWQVVQALAGAPGRYAWLLNNSVDVVAEDVIYYLPAQQFLGKAKILAEAEQWLKFEDGVLSTNTREIIGRTIFNARGPIKQTLA